VKSKKKRIKCNRCGKCCHFLSDDGVIRACIHLVKSLDKAGKARYFCSIYSKRLGAKCGIKYNGKDVLCGKRMQSHFDFVGCPYNTNKSLFWMWAGKGIDWLSTVGVEECDEFE